MITAAFIWVAMGLFLAGATWALLQEDEEPIGMILSVSATVLFAWPFLAVYNWARR